MNKIITHLDLDLASSNEYKVINAQQLDNNTRRLEVNLFHEGKIYDITNVTKIELQGFRGDGETIKTPLTNDGNNIIVDFDNSILGAKGICKLKIALFGEDNKLLSSFPFVIRIDQNVYDETGVIASPVYLELENELKNIEDLKSDIETKLDDNYFVLKKDKDVAGGVPSLDSNTKVPIAELYEATTTRKGITQLTDSVTSTSTTTAATPNSVKTVNDSLNSEISRAKSAESTLTTNLNNEITRAKSAENDLDSKKVDKTTVATSTTLGLVKSGTDITVDTSGNVSVNDNSHKHNVSNISDLTATASELNVLDGITATTTELNYTDGVTSNIQTQLNSKSSNGHTHDDRYYTESEIDTTVTDINSSISSHTSNTSNPHSVTKAQVGLGNVENKSSATIRGEITKSNVTTALGYTPYTPNEIDNKFSALETNIDWKESVSTFDDIATTYPNPIDGWTVNVKDTDYTYRYNGTSWVAISANAIPKATNNVDGLLSKEDHTNYEDANSKKHTHSNKSVIDGISSTNVSDWDSAKTHADSTHARTDATKVEASSTNGNIKINGTETTVYVHPSGTNPHGTTKSDVGLGNVPNVATNDQTPSYTEATTLAKLTSGEKLSVAFGKISKAITDLISHIGDSVKHITSTERTNWNAAKTHADSAHAPSNAQQNVQSDWNATSGDAFIKNKPTIPTRVGELTNDKDYATKTDVTKAIDDIEIGGRNLLLKTKDYSDWVGRGDTTIHVLNNNVGETSILQVTTNGSSDGDVMLNYSGVTKKEKHLLSFFARNISGDKTINFETYGGPVYSVQATDEWKKFEVEIIPEADTVHYFFFNNKNNVSIFQLKNVKLENGNKATPWTPAIEDTEAEIQAVDNKLTTNLLKPILGTVTQNGVTCTNNGDGTYTLNGTATNNYDIQIFSGNMTFENAKLIGCPKGGSDTTYRMFMFYDNLLSNNVKDYGSGSNEISVDDKNVKVIINIYSGVTYNNLVFKPMITTNLNATYDDFVPYTGSTGQINSDVAEVRKDFDEHTHEIANVTGLQSALDGKASSSHTHTKSQITDFPTSLPASDVYAWAKESTKPSYTALEVGALPISDKNGVEVETSTTFNKELSVAKSLFIFRDSFTNMDFTFNDSNSIPYWNYFDGESEKKLYHPNKSGTIATTDDIKMYSAGTGITLSGTTFSNSGVRSITSGSTNGTISVNTNGTSAEVVVKGLGSAAYTSSSNYASSSHTHNYAGSSSAGGSATSANALNQLFTYSSRPTSANIDFSSSTYSNKLTFMMATNSMTTGKPPADAIILNIPWDNGKYGCQLATRNGQTTNLYLRNAQSDGTYTDWKTVAFTDDTLPLSGGTMSGKLSITGTQGFSLKNAYTYPARIYTSDRSLILTGVGTASDSSCALEISSCSNGILPKSYTNGETYTTGSAGGVNLGSSSRKFGTIYSTSSTLNSDKKEKKDIINLQDSEFSNDYVNAYKDMNFVRFKWKQNKNGGLEIPPSNRNHYGIIAQDIEKLLNSLGIDNYDNGIIKSSFFADNTSGAFITGGYYAPYYDEEKDIQYDYSENVWKYKHDLEYDTFNEVIEKNISEITGYDLYANRSDIGYIMIEDNSKVQAEGKQPPVKINGIALIDKDGNIKNLNFYSDKNVKHYEWDDEDYSNPLTDGVENEDGSITISFNEKYSKYFIKVDDFNIFDYEKIIINVDYIGEYKVYLLPNPIKEHVNANVWDRGRVDDSLLTYSVDYNELHNMCFYALQQITKEQEKEITQLKKSIEELKGMITNA